MSEEIKKKVERLEKVLVNLEKAERELLHRVERLEVEIGIEEEVDS